MVSGVVKRGLAGGAKLMDMGINLVVVHNLAE
jgi:hypothetical protein